MSSSYPSKEQPDVNPLRAEADIVAALTRQADAVKTSNFPDAVPFTVVPEGFTVHAIPRLDAPDRSKGTVKLRDADSFVAYVERHKTIRTTIYATIDPAAFVVVLNDHAPNDESRSKAITPAQAAKMASANAPGFRDWRAEFLVPASREWKLWNGSNRKEMGQIGFATFIEENLPDFFSPEGADMLEMALNFESAKTGSFRSAVRLSNGSVNLEYVDEVSGNGAVKVPSVFKIGIPVFENEAARLLEARLKYRIGDGGKLAIWFELVRPHKVLEAAYREASEAIATKTGIKPLLGTPE